jgi:CAAX prenyl protease-like protein
MPNPETSEQSTRRRPLLGDDVAYMLPMGAFLLFTWAGGQWPSLFVASYVAKTFIAALLLVVLWRHYTPIRWNYWWLGILMGVVGVVQWVGMEKGLLHVWPNYPRIEGGEPFDPTRAFASPATMWGFIAIRWAGASLVVPVMEELFWRDYLWRTIAAPADFKLARIGEWDRGIPLVAVSVLFCLVHHEWMTAIVWGLMVGGLLAYTRSLGACILMHGVTNFLLGAYVLRTHDWKFW